MRWSTLLAAIVFSVAALGAGWCWAQGTNNDLRRSMGNLRPSRPTPNLRRSMGNLLPENGSAGQAARARQARSARSSPVVVAPVYPGGCYDRGYGYYPPGYGSYYGPRYYPGYYSVYPRVYYGSPYYYLPPVAFPAEQLFGPRASLRFMLGR